MKAKELFSIVSQDVQGVRFPIGHGIAGYVAEKGEYVNCKNAYADSRFDKSWDLKARTCLLACCLMTCVAHSLFPRACRAATAPRACCACL